MKPLPIMESLYPFQKRAVEFHLNHHYSMNGCKMGLGKTVQAIATIAHIEGTAVVVCPAYLRKNWLNEIDKFLPEHKPPIYVMSYEKFQKLSPPHCKILVFDEAHYLKNMQSKRTKYTHEYVKRVKPDHLILLTGTPIKNRVSEFYSLMKLCSYNPRKTSGLPLTKGFYVFANALCKYRDISTPYGTTRKFFGLKNKPLLIKYLEGKYFSAKNDNPLPKLQRQNILVDSIKNKELIEQLEEDFASNHISSAKKNIAVEKARFTAAYVTDCMLNDEKPLLVFSDHIESCERIKWVLDSKGITNNQVITGSTPAEMRHNFVAKFQQRCIDVLICTIGSMSTGFTLTATNRVIFNDLSWCPADNEQAEKRIHRIGQTKDCYVVHILSEGIDKKIMEVLEEKQRTLSRVFKE